jgi:hypothetical protein
MRFAGGYAIALAAVLAGLLLYVAALRYSPPEPRPDTAPTTQFSAVRAKATLARVLGQGEPPHPAGTPANAAVRERIVAELQGLGLTPRVEKGFACGGLSCGFSANIVCEIPGATADAVLLASHYDSVPAAPGAGDDGVGVAALLEIARVLKEAPTPRRSMVLLFDEGEEDGLLGARAFVKTPDMARVRAVVNVDARGNGGPAVMFEASVGAAPIRAIAAGVDHPFTSSAFAAAYAKMPNGTDFTVFEDRAPAPVGANFALLGDIATYHTPLDKLDNLDLGSLQHVGDATLATARGLGDAELGAAGDAGRLVWFDVLALRVFSWPEAWAMRTSLAALVLVVLAVAARIARRRIGVMDLVRGLGLLPIALVGCAVGASVVAMLMSSGVLPAPWSANAPYAMAAMWTLGAALAAAAAAALTRDLGEGAWCGVWLTIASLGVVLAVYLPGATYVMCVPAGLAGLVGLATARPDKDDVGDGALLVAALVPGLALVALLAPVALLLYSALGLAAAPYAAILAALMATTFTPLHALAAPATRWLLAGALVLGALALFGATAYSPAFTEKFPARANVIFAQDEKAARVMVDMRWGAQPWGPVPAPMRLALGMAREAPRYPWSPALTLGAEQPKVELASPDAAIVTTADEGAERRITVHLQSRRGAHAMAALLPPGAHARFARANGTDLVATVAETEWRQLRVTGMPDEGVTLEIVASREPVTLTVVDETSGVPASAAPIVAARPTTAVPTQRGDVTVVSRTLPL